MCLVPASFWEGHATRRKENEHARILRADYGENGPCLGIWDRSLDPTLESDRGQCACKCFDRKTLPGRECAEPVLACPVNGGAGYAICHVQASKRKGLENSGRIQRDPDSEARSIGEKEKEEREEVFPGNSGDLLIPKVYFVFQAKDLEGIPALEEKAKPADWSGKAEAIRQKLSSTLSISVGHGGGRAFYSRSDDRIQMPVEGNFENEEAYLGTLLHEFGHATGHEKRLNRPFGVFGDPAYAFEELVAEMTSLFVGMTTGITPDDKHFENHAAYVDSWIQVLKKDKKALVRASKQAQDACDLLVSNIKRD